MAGNKRRYPGVPPLVVEMPADEKRRLKLYCAEDGTDMTKFVRKAIEQALNRKERDSERHRRKREPAA